MSWPGSPASLGHFQRGGGDPAHPGGQRTHTPDQQVGLEAAGQGTGELAVHPDPRPEREVGISDDEGPRDDVVMTVEILGRRVHHEVGAERQRLGVDRRGNGVVDRDQGAARVRDLGCCRDVGDQPGRIRRGLQPDQVRRRGGDGCAQRVEVAGRHLDHVETGGGAELPQPAGQTEVHDVGHHDPRPRGQGGEHRDAGRQPGGEQQSVGTPFQLGQQVLGLP
jgi:hypothetical protein